MVKIGHEVKLIAPQYVRPFVKRQKNDAADAEAIVVAAQRPEMTFVGTKDEDQQASAVLFRSRERLIQQRTVAVNALRSILYEFGHVVPSGIRNIRRIGKFSLQKTAICHLWFGASVWISSRRSGNRRPGSRRRPRRPKNSPRRMMSRGDFRRYRVLVR